ncbi:hypothetical protein [Spirillospora sp. NPDC047279]|uniref:hypothetical protein n=1 Tax=Spirillospora sp. NPDC047279 TaxID=3155478 RepID=UPI0033F38F2A
MIDMAALVGLSDRVQSWLEDREDISERDGALTNPTHYTEWESSDDEASDIVHYLAGVLGVKAHSN